MDILFKGLAIFLSAVMVIALTLFVIGRIPVQGFFTLTLLLGIVAFVILPVMRKKFVEK